MENSKIEIMETDCAYQISSIISISISIVVLDWKYYYISSMSSMPLRARPFRAARGIACLLDVRY